MLTNYPHHIQEQVIRSIRKFFEEKNFHEIIPPVFADTIPLEPNLYPFISHWHPGKETVTKYLATSPERSLKLALAQGIGNCFAIGHSFRDLEGSGPIHSPEFLMLEWYREDAVHTDIMRDVQELIHHITHDAPLLHTENNKPWPKFSLVNLFQDYANQSIEDLVKDNALYEHAEKKGYSLKDATWSLLFDQIFLNEVEPHLPKSPFFLIDFPSRISPLCKPRTDTPYLAERFELYIDGMELGNGNTEHTDASYVRDIFRQERVERKRRHLPCPPEDTEFLNALEKMQEKSYAGIGVGVYRLCLLMGAGL